MLPSPVPFRWMMIFLAVGVMSSTAVVAKDSMPIKVASSTAIVTDWLLAVGGDRIIVTTLIERGGDPHAYSPGPRDASILHKQQLVVLIGHGLELPIEAVLDGYQGTTLLLAESIDATLPKVNVEKGHVDHFHCTDGHVGHDHQHGGHDPHIWMDIQKTRLVITKIRDVLTSFDPSSKDFFTSRAADYDHQLTNLHRWISEQIVTIPEAQRILITGHDAFSFYSSAHGLRSLGSLLGSNSSVAADPAPQRLAHLAAAAKSAGVKALFPEQGHSKRLISALSRESGIPLAPVLTVGNLGSPNAPDGTYIGLMINNTSIIVQALGGKVAKMVSQE